MRRIGRWRHPKEADIINTGMNGEGSWSIQLIGLILHSISLQVALCKVPSIKRVKPLYPVRRSNYPATGNLIVARSTVNRASTYCRHAIGRLIEMYKV